MILFMNFAALSARLAANVSVKQASTYVATPCHCWTGRCNNSGYPTLTVRVADRAHPVPVYAHRVSAQIAAGLKATPKGKQVDHRCYNTACVNPEHLEIVTARVNYKRRRVAH